MIYLCCVADGKLFVSGPGVSINGVGSPFQVGRLIYGVYPGALCCCLLLVFAGDW